MPYQTWLADAAAEAAIEARVTVTEWSNWRTRGNSSFNPRGTVVHHDASSTASGNNGALTIVVNGRSDLPGPLGNYFIKRNGDIVVVAAGRANHAGSGGWQGLSGNSSVIGIEAANNGVGESWSASMVRSYVALNRAIIRRGVPLLCAHKEWTTRKIDPHGGPFGTTRSIASYRTMVSSNTPVTNKEEEVSARDIVRELLNTEITLATWAQNRWGNARLSVSSLLRASYAWSHRAYEQADANSKAIRAIVTELDAIATRQGIDQNKLAKDIAANLEIEISEGASPQDVIDTLYERLRPG